MSNTRRRSTVYTFVQNTIRVAVVFLALVCAITAILVYNTIAAELTGYAAESGRVNALNTAARLEASFRSAYADALTLLELNRTAAGGRQAALFFELHPEFAALVSTSGTRLVNETFFGKHGLNEKAIDRCMEAERELLERTIVEDGWTVLPANASPYFGAPVLALFFKAPESGVSAGGAALAAFFSADVFSRLLGDGADITYLVNIRDDVLLHTEAGITLSGRNYWQEPLVRIMRTSGGASADTVFKAADGKTYLGAFQKLSTAGLAALCETDKNTVLAPLRQGFGKCRAVYGAAFSVLVIFFAAASILVKRYASMAAAEQENGILERARMRNIFRSLPDSREDDAALSKIPLDGDRRDVTVVYAALRMTGKKQSPQKFMETVNNALSMAIDSFTKTGGAADALDEDGLSGVWGGPFSEDGAEMDAVNAIRGAILLRAALIKNCPPDPFAPPRPMPVCCGIHSGAALAGLVGVGKHATYRYTGGALKRARLIAAQNKRLGTDILISESTMKLAGKYFITEEMPPVKALKKKIRVFAVINVKVTKSGVEQPKPANMSELRQMLRGVL